MLLRPRKFIRKNKQKHRSYVIPRNSTTLNYGQIGLKLLYPLKLFSKQMFRFKLFIKKGSRRSDKTRRKAWLSAFPHLPITKKIAGSRMGKGKGKLKDWGTMLPAGVNIIEFRNLRFGRAKYFLKQMQYKIRSKTVLIYRYKQVNTFFKLNKTVKYERRW